ncbi:DUF423 domain-containing protein [Listeria welshimeri]|uniref:Putative membrane protein n=1 Tax=Listeria welshimeri serovar 6b (strain ATCC 35897 / DSM 20650 / CCUG 15529 / CIP 8149 / NCTC 11857 / SLCC 5334 / V8) TaxID=386043 RepID=A0AGC0_LISW6|nr:DUF423 domain-containing protein [Listeria welshimeri]MBC1354891.1 DUF423 domain-containing protein [Listeria welshimeri]MBC1447014.1 DUF423 domain-containing protein [Listeria welshimeri]MBC1449274.1 DUF423 domain-containing protein [Listeria welshimeri]MBC1463196.1 DUF423 domain-containing protein [Listeria welshimeri]MBC1477400.1 DUF423 domain-containing protein [Listeria welshimeri]
MKKTIITGAVFAGLAVLLGAFGAHALKDVLGRYASTWETGVQYQMFHAVGILIIGLLMEKQTSRLYNWAAILFSVGIVFFSGSLYVLSISKVTVLGAITPIGGVCFVVGWFLLILGVSKRTMSK